MVNKYYYKAFQTYGITRNFSSHSTCSSPATATNGRPPVVTVTVFVTVWPWPLTFRSQDHCMPRSFNGVYMNQVWYW